MTHATLTAPRSRALSPDEREAFLLRAAESYDAYIRRLRDEAYVYPEMMVTHGFAVAQHPPTIGLMAYRHDAVRQESARLIRQEVADRAMGKHLTETK